LSQWRETRRRHRLALSLGLGAAARGSWLYLMPL